jgi:hypothetical protein
MQAAVPLLLTACRPQSLHISRVCVCSYACMPAPHLVPASPTSCPRYKMPESLQEFKLVAQGASKPLLLLALLHELAGQASLVFCSSLEATHKLALLLAATSPEPQQVRWLGCTYASGRCMLAELGVLPCPPVQSDSAVSYVPLRMAMATYKCCRHVGCNMPVA